MQFYKAFFTNISLLITIGYIFNLAYKYIFVRTDSKLKAGMVPVLFICAGWLAMLFGLQLTDAILFDLRFVPILFAAVVFRKPATLVLIGLGIGAGRFFYGVHAAAWAGFANMALLGLAAALLVIWFNKRDWSFGRRALISIFAINTLNMINIALIGVIPAREYLREIGVITYPLGIALSGLFIFIIYDFQKERKRIKELREMNVVLRRQTRELRIAKRELEEKARQLMQASRYKSEFLANMSHELKTPLNSIILLSQMMKEHEPESQSADEELNYAGIIHAAGNDLLYLINDILDLSKVEAGKMDINAGYVAMEELLQLTQHQFMALAQQKGLRFEVILGEGLPEGLYTDALRVNQILRNLLVNAFKFTEAGSITLKVTAETDTTAVTGMSKMGRRRFLSWSNAAWYGGFNSAVNRAIRRGQRGTNDNAARTGEQRQWIVFAVQDTGIGIDEEKQEQIFEAFQQADGATTRKYGGTGLGLSISLQLAQLLGGTLTLRSRRGEGSTFELRLPLLEMSDPPAQEPETASERQP
ncbi:sensor histidine kinase [Paenibacillus sp. 1P07SE]|uniref:sensor histidine kinase n=1 Tax=Paenibacillus sp. 1P07SE TaxID=3132209 RepID=UPI0039A55746